MSVLWVGGGTETHTQQNSTYWSTYWNIHITTLHIFISPPSGGPAWHDNSAALCNVLRCSFRFTSKTCKCVTVNCMTSSCLPSFLSFLLFVPSLWVLSLTQHLNRNGLDLLLTGEPECKTVLWVLQSITKYLLPQMWVHNTVSFTRALNITKPHVSF